MRSVPATAQRMLNQLSLMNRTDEEWKADRRAFIERSDLVQGRTGWSPAAFVNPGRVVVATLAVVSEYGCALVDALADTVFLVVPWERFIRYDRRIKGGSSPTAIWWITIGFCFYDR
ncbi:MAG TPA: hypothetical protein VGZ03_00345, partial [Acidimicrobiales bacterium]|nr:hypothetical protein [Acidimicrobiales bacterium]